jgi:hypothetical protein
MAFDLNYRISQLQQSMYGFEICCVGFNNETSMLSAIIKISNPPLWGHLCTKGATARVGFWTQSAGKLLFIGESTVRIFDLPPKLFFGGTMAPRHYALHLMLTPEAVTLFQSCADDKDFAKMHCLLTISNVPITSVNFRGAQLATPFQLKSDVPIQFPRKSHFGIWNVYQRHNWESQVFPVHAALLPDGRVLVFSGAVGNWWNWFEKLFDQDDEDDRNDADEELLVWQTCGAFDPDTLLFTMLQAPFSGPGRLHDLFCSGHSVLADGNVFVVGGTLAWGPPDGYHEHNQHMSGISNTSTIVLSNGEVFIMGGHPHKSDETRHTNTDMEIYVPSIDAFRYPGTKGVKRQNITTEFWDGYDTIPGSYDRLHLMPNGSVFCTNLAASKNFVWDFKTEIWAPIFSGPAPGYEIQGWDDNSSVLLPFLVDNEGNYSDAEVLVLIKDKAFRCKPLLGQGWKETTRRLLTGWRTRFQGLLLPNGKVLFAGGNNSSGTVYDIEIYDPKTDSWVLGDSMNTIRQYHSLGILLKDARVLMAGADNYSGEYGDDNLEDRQLSIEVYTPDYLWNNPRPVFSVFPSSFNYGDKMTVFLGEDWTRELVSNAVIIRLYAVTHSGTADQRLVELRILETTNKQQFFLQIPANPSLVPPGYYYLFVNSKVGTPSVAQIIHIS